MPVKERLKEFIKLKNISDRRFCTTVGLSHTYINNIRRTISPEKVQQIKVHYPELNIEWLLTGEGEMLKGKEGIVKEPLANYGRSSTDEKLIEFLMNQNKSLEQIVHDQNEIMKSMQERIRFVESELEHSKNESTAHEKGAGCAAVV